MQDRGCGGFFVGAGISLYDVLLSVVSASVVLVSISLVCTVWPYDCVSAILIVCCMVCGSRRVSAF